MYFLIHDISTILIISLLLAYRRMNTLLEAIAKNVQNRQRAPRKPDVLPVSSTADMDAFETLPDNDYSDVVSIKI